MATLEIWARIFRGHTVKIVKGEHEGKKGTFMGVSDCVYNNDTVCDIQLDFDKQVYCFTSAYFQFLNKNVQEKWNNG